MTPITSQAVLSHQATTVQELTKWMAQLIGNPVPEWESDRTFVTRIESFQIVPAFGSGYVVVVVVVTEYIPEEENLSRGVSKSQDGYETEHWNMIHHSKEAVYGQ